MTDDGSGTIDEIADEYELTKDDDGRAVAARILDAIRAPSESAPTSWADVSTRLKFYHGTSWERAQKIRREGFAPSEDGCLGRGVYVGRKDKALRFAKDAERHGGASGGLVTAVISFSYPKFVPGDDDGWQLEGHDACRASFTSRSEKMEWCVRSADQVFVTGIEEIALDGDGDASASAEAAPLQLVEPVGAGALASGASLNAWRCEKCGAADNFMWHPCQGCGAPKPLSAIGEAAGLARAELTGAHHTELGVATQGAGRVAYRVGAMGGWMAAMDDAVSGADHPPALGHTELMLPAPQRKVRWAERTPSFAAAVDAFKSQPMPPPPPRSPRPNHFSKRAGDRLMPPARAPKRLRADDESSDSGHHSRNTSEYTYNETYHARARAFQRELARVQLQRCLKRGVRTREPEGKWKYVYDGITLITGDTEKDGEVAITAYRGGGGPPLLPDGEWPLDLHRPATALPPPSPSSPGASTPRESNSREPSLSRSDAGADAFVGRGSERAGRVATGAGLGAIREYRPDSSDDVLRSIKEKALLVNNIALRGDAREAGVLWDCEGCTQRNNLAWRPCLACGAKYPTDARKSALKSARHVLNQPHDLARAREANPHRLGVIGGYAYGRYAAVADDDETRREQPAAFDKGAIEGLPERAKRDECSLPDQRVLGITLSQGATPWPETEPASEPAATGESS